MTLIDARHSDEVGSADDAFASFVGDSRLARELYTTATAIHEQQKLATAVVDVIGRTSMPQSYGLLLHRKQLTTIALAINWLPAFGHNAPRVPSVLAVSEEHSFVGRVIDIDHDAGTFAALMRRIDAHVATGDEIPVRLPLDQVVLEHRHRLRIGIRVDWSITRWPLGDGSISSRSKLVVHPPREFTPDEQRRIEGRARSLAEMFAVNGSDGS